MKLRNDFRLQDLDIITSITRSEKTEVYLVSGAGLFENALEFAILKKYKSKLSQEHYYRIAENPAPYFPVLYGIWEEGEESFLLEEYIPGRTLLKICEDGGHLQEQELTHYMTELCKALQVLHSMNPPIIHRDLKPENIIITDTGQVKLLDFDASREYKKKQKRDTVYLGTKEYASPEQFGFMQTDIRSDIYSWGIVFAELLEHASVGKRYAREARKIIARATMFDPERRYANMQAVLSALGKLGKNSRGVWVGGCALAGLALVFMLSFPYKDAAGGNPGLLRELLPVANVQPEVTIKPLQEYEEVSDIEPEIVSWEEAYHYVSLEDELLRKQAYIMTKHSYLYNFQFDVSGKDGWYSENQETIIGRDYPTFRFLRAYPRDVILRSDVFYGANIKSISICRYDEEKGENDKWIPLEEGDYTRPYDDILKLKAEFMQKLAPGLYTVQIESGKAGIDSIGGFYLSVHGEEDKVDNFFLRIEAFQSYYSSAKRNDVAFFVNNSSVPIREIYMADDLLSREEYDLIEKGHGVVFHSELLEKYKDLEGVDVQVVMENENRAICRIINLDVF